MPSITIPRDDHPGKSDAEIANALAADRYFAVVRYKNPGLPEFSNFGLCEIPQHLVGYLNSPHCHEAEVVWERERTETSNDTSPSRVAVDAVIDNILTGAASEKAAKQREVEAGKAAIAKLVAEAREQGRMSLRKKWWQSWARPAQPQGVSSAEELVDVKAAEWLIGLLTRCNSDDRDKIQAALVEIGHSALSPLISALNNKDRWARWGAVNALGDIGDPRAVEPLVSALKDSDEWVSTNAATGLGRIRDARAVEPLIAALQDERGNVCRSAAEALGMVGDTRAVKPLLALLRSESSYVRSSAAIALGNIRDSGVVEPLIAALPAGNEGWKVYQECSLRKEIARPLGEVGDARAIKPLVAAALKDTSSSGVDARVAVAEALGKIGGAQTVEPLVAALKDEWKKVREAAVEALGKVGDARAVEPLGEVLMDKSWENGRACELAAAALAKMRRPG